MCLAVDRYVIDSILSGYTPSLLLTDIHHMQANKRLQTNKKPQTRCLVLAGVMPKVANL
jgi:hypothetical protein